MGPKTSGCGRIKRHCVLCRRPAVNEARRQQDDADVFVVQPAPEHILEPPTPPSAPPLPQPLDQSTVLPGRWTNRPDTHPMQACGESSTTNEDDESEEDAESPARPTQDVSCIPDFPARSTRSGLTRNGGGCSGAILVLDDAAHPPIAFRLVFLAGFTSRNCPTPATCAREWQHPMPMTGRRPWTER
jgi:hypothetical protein